LIGFGEPNVITEKEETIWLYKVQGDGYVEHREEQPLVLSYLDSNTCFILDCKTELYIWHGKQADTLRQCVALTIWPKNLWFYLQRSICNLIIQPLYYLTNPLSRPKWVIITPVYEKEEPVLFKEYFLYWQEAPLAGTVKPKPLIQSRAGSRPKLIRASSSMWLIH